MCRLFGFRSVLDSGVHTSLVGAENALREQGQAHPDGWGVAYYHAGAPHLVKSVQSALRSQLFERVSGLVSSQTVLAHLRKATLGDMTILNTHPFQYGRWVFAHNGNIKSFAGHKDSLREMIRPELVRFILGETDSELLFYILLSEIAEKGDLVSGKLPLGDIMDAAIEAVSKVIHLVGPFNEDDAGDPSETYLSFLLTDGEMMLGHQGGKALCYSTHKNRCPERDTCPMFNGTCEQPVLSGKVNHLIFSSEPLSGENVWTQLEPGNMIGVGRDMEIEVRSGN